MSYWRSKEKTVSGFVTAPAAMQCGPRHWVPLGCTSASRRGRRAWPRRARDRHGGIATGFTLETRGWAPWWAKQACSFLKKRTKKLLLFRSDCYSTHLHHPHLNKKKFFGSFFKKEHPFFTSPHSRVTLAPSPQP
jgi:hypothetical protein